MALFSPLLESGFLTWNIHTRGTNCEDVIPGIAFGPCSHRETVKRRKMHTLGAILLPSLSLSHSRAHPSSTPYADRSTGFQPCISWKVYREASTEFFGLGPREKFNMRLSRVGVTSREREYTRARRSCSPRADTTIRRHKARKYKRLRERWKLKLTDGITWDCFDPLPIRVENVFLNVYYVVLRGDISSEFLLFFPLNAKFHSTVIYKKYNIRLSILNSKEHNKVMRV